MNYRKNVIVLMGGAATAQAIPIVISPFLTRLYSPADFGVMAVFMSVCAILSVFSSGRYDQSLIEPADEKDARGLLFAGLTLSLLFCILLFPLIWLIYAKLSGWMNLHENNVWLYFIPIAVFFMTCQSLFLNWFNRCKKFSSMNSIRIMNAILISLLSLALAFSKFRPLGLIIGFILGQCLTVLYHWHFNIKGQILLPKLPVTKAMKKYKRYPIYLVPATLSGTVASEAPILLLTKFFNSTISGYFSFVNRVTVSPLAIVGNAIGETYKIRAAEYYHQNGECLKIFYQHVAALALIGIVPWAILFFAGPVLFAFVFGEQWYQAGVIASTISFLLWFQLVSTPLAYTVTFNHSLNLDMYLQICRGIGSIFAMVYGYYQQDYMLGIELYCIVFCSYYFFHSLLQWRAAKGIGNINQHELY